MGVLSDKYSPIRYLPGDFAIDKKLDWINGAYLDYECDIQFTS